MLIKSVKCDRGLKIQSSVCVQIQQYGICNVIFIHVYSTMELVSCRPASPEMYSDFLSHIFMIVVCPLLCQ